MDTNRELQNTVRNIVRQMQSTPDNQPVDKVSIGHAILWAGPTTKIPTGFMLCDGRNVKISDYSALYQMLGTTYNSGTPAGSFRIPNYPTVADSATATVGRWVIRYV